MRRLSGIICSIFILVVLTGGLTGCGASKSGSAKAGSAKTDSSKEDSVKTEAPADGWLFKCVTEDDEPVADVRLQICTDATCQMVKSDDKGTVLFDKCEEGVEEYDLHVLSVPEGYELDCEVPEKMTKDNRVITITFKKQ